MSRTPTERRSTADLERARELLSVRDEHELQDTVECFGQVLSILKRWEGQDGEEASRPFHESNPYTKEN